MRTLILLALMVVFGAGCTFDRGGSQSLTFNPFDWGTSTPAVRPADGFGYVDGERLDMRR